MSLSFFSNYDVLNDWYRKGCFYAYFKHEQKCHLRILALKAVTPSPHRASRVDNGIGAQENHKALTCQRPLIQVEYIQKTPATQRQAIQGPLALQSSFCRGTAKLLLLVFLFFFQKHKDPQCRKGSPTFYCFISSGNFPFATCPWRLSPCPEALMHISTQNK